MGEALQFDGALVENIPMRVELAVRTEASHEHKGETQSTESLKINTQTKNHHTPEVNRAQNQEKIKIQLPEKSPGVTLIKTR